MSDPYNLVRKGGKTLEEEAIIRHQEAVERKSKNLDRVYLDGKSVLNSIFKESYGETTKIPMGSVDLKITAGQIRQLRNKTGENDMTTLQTVNVTLVDNNSNLRGEAKIVFKKHNHLTEYGIEDTKMNIISEGGVKDALIKHNTEVRTKTVDKDIQRSTGRDVMLEPIELLSDSDLEWRYVVIGQSLIKQSLQETFQEVLTTKQEGSLGYPLFYQQGASKELREYNMYVNKVRDKIKELQQERDGVCEKIMDDRVIDQFLDGDGVATLEESIVTEDYEIPLKFFFNWLGDNGFVSEKRVVEAVSCILINMPPEQQVTLSILKRVEYHTKQMTREVLQAT